MYSDIFCKVYNEFGWNYYPQGFAEQLLLWLGQHGVCPGSSMDLACGTGILCRILHENGVRASGVDLSPGMIDIARRDNPGMDFQVADMITFCPNVQYDLVTCTGDAINHIAELSDVERIFRNVFACTRPGGYFIFDILNEHEVSDSEPFETDFSDTTRVWFQMTRPGQDQVNLQVRVFENGREVLCENIRETIHDPGVICALLESCGFTLVKCADRLPDGGTGHGTTWFVIARRPPEG